MSTKDIVFGEDYKVYSFSMYFKVKVINFDIESNKYIVIIKEILDDEPHPLAQINDAFKKAIEMKQEFKVKKYHLESL